MTTVRAALVIPLLLLAAACGPAHKDTTMASSKNSNGSQPSAAAPAASTRTLIPRELLFGNPERAGTQISPDGKHLSWLAPVDGVLNVWVAPADDLSKARAITHDRKRGVRMYFWSFTNEHVLYVQDEAGDENWRVHAVSLKDGTTKDLTPFAGAQAQVLGVSPKFPTEILVGLNNRDPQFHDVHRVNVVTGKMQLVQKNEGFAGFVTDDDYKVRLAVKMTADGGQQLLRPGKNAGKKAGTWDTYLEIPMEDTLGTGPVGFDKTGKIMFMTDSRGRNTSALVEMDFEKKQPRVIAQDAKADLGNVIVHPTEKTVQAVVFTYERDRWEVLDPKLQADLDVLKKVADGEIGIGSRTLDDSQWIVSFMLDDGPVRIYRYDRVAKKATFLFTNQSALEKVKLAKMHPVTIKATDGLELVSYLTLPRDSDPDGDGRPAKPLPMILLVHGGPWGRDGWGLNGEHQWLADRGYAVLAVNFRGSTGLGKKFLNAANLEWAGTMHRDLLDAKKWAVANGITTADKVGIMGGSYGGYATLVGLTFTPDEFACGVDIVGPSNLVTLLESIPPYWAPMIELFAKRVGDPRTEAGKKLLLERSPLSRVDAIKKPLIIGQGANDPRVKQAEADQIVNAMKAKKIPVVYALFPDEGHGFARPENNLAFYAVTEHFLAKHLGGAAEPIGDDLNGSSIQIPEGADQIPGLQDALKSATRTVPKDGGI